MERPPKLREKYRRSPGAHSRLTYLLVTTKTAPITGVICGVRIEEIEDPLMRNIRYMDKLVDELAKGRAMEKILRG